MMKTLFVAWQDPKTRQWLPVGRLSREDDDYHFVYTRGAEASERFVPFGRMTNLHDAYVAKKLLGAALLKRRWTTKKQRLSEVAAGTY